jgi:hypothetical protein
VRYGAKALPEGGWNTSPRSTWTAGSSSATPRLRELDAPQGHPPGDAQRHARRRDGVRGRARGDTSSATLRRYKTRVDESAIKAELYPVRNVHQAFGAGLMPARRSPAWR